MYGFDSLTAMVAIMEPTLKTQKQGADTLKDAPKGSNFGHASCQPNPQDSMVSCEAKTSKNTHFLGPELVTRCLGKDEWRCKPGEWLCPQRAAESSPGRTCPQRM